jgi:hypothetical protein
MHTWPTGIGTSLAMLEYDTIEFMQPYGRYNVTAPLQ